MWGLKGGIEESVLLAALGPYPPKGAVTKAGKVSREILMSQGEDL